MTVPPLPPPGPNQAYWEVSALEAGDLVLPCVIVVSTATPDEFRPVPTLAFLLTRPESDASSVKKPKYILFDLGIRKDLETALPPNAVDSAKNTFNGRSIEDITDALAKGGLTPADIERIFLSHIHWDHCGNPALFPTSRFGIGSATRTLFDTGYPKDPESHFPSNLLPPERTDFLEVNEDWKPIGPFPHTLDFFGDGSLYLINAPGHLPGHLNLLVRVSSSGDWLYLAGDSAHDWRLVRGEGEIAVRHDPKYGRVCMHFDEKEAAGTIRRIAEVMTLPQVKVILAHDNEWYEKNRGGPSFWPGKFSFP